MPKVRFPAHHEARPETTQPRTLARSVWLSSWSGSSG